MSILKEIYNYKLIFVEKQKMINPLSSIKSKIITESDQNRNFYNKLKNESERISIIGEIKRASPSLGEFVSDNIDILELAKTYEYNDISCLSVLTDEKYFNGSINDLMLLRKSINIPILRKDFIVDEYQIYESKLYGADCILIILSMLEQEDANKFVKIAFELGMDSIIEVHDINELQRAKEMKSDIIGINNRDLKNFETDLQTTIELSKNIKNENKLLISESGFHSKKDIIRIHNETGISNFLVGEYLMKSKNLKLSIDRLIN